MAIDHMQLLKRLREVDSQRAARIERLSKIVAPLLDRIYSIFPDYTDHSRVHSERVMSILDWLLPSGMATPLSATELFYLLAAALLHDVGMLDEADQSGDDQAQERIRDSHHLSLFST